MNMSEQDNNNTPPATILDADGELMGANSYTEEDKPEVPSLLDPEWEVLTVSPSHAYLACVVEEKDGWCLCKPLYDYVSQLTQLPPKTAGGEPMIKRVRMAFVHELLPSTAEMVIPIKPVYRLQISKLSPVDQKNYVDLIDQVGKQLAELTNGPPRLTVVGGTAKLPPISEILKGKKP